MYPVLRVASLCLAIAATGCNAIGPRALQSGRINYNEAIAQTWNEQLLRNLVRLKYRDTLVFLEVSSVSTQYSVSYSAGASGSFIGAGANDELGLDTGVGFSERPTVIYTPLQGQEFVTQLLSPIPLDALILLSQSGWSIERVLRICAQRMNELDNAASASGPTPALAPVFEEFHKAARLMRTLQINGGLRALLEPSDTDEDAGAALVFRFSPGATKSEEAQALRRLLGVPEGTEALYVRDGWYVGDADRLAVQTRSMLGVMHFLSNAVESPQAHRDAGWVVTTRNEDGGEFDWGDAATKDLLKISWQNDRPRDAFVATKYRGGWFYIDNADLHSKTTFGLLTYLFYLQAGEIKSFGPTLTLPVGQ
ncbi:MAG: hypothetical protein IID09_04370 [Candidatus Hydrogenedentes bacterium]|nr:hypothetical protein [Candidatus Hydrogenedentota bacterium]